MKISQVEIGTKFVYNGDVYCHDLEGRSGGGKVALNNLTSGCKESLRATTEVEEWMGEEATPFVIPEQIEDYLSDENDEDESELFGNEEEPDEFHGIDLSGYDEQLEELN